MLLHENFTEAHIRELQSKSKRDPVLLERAVYAFGLLEALARVGMPFIFKGGTCLMLLLDKPKRLSTDIDIIIEPGTNLDDYLQKAAVIFPFVSVEEQKRIGKNKIEKRHFKFTYDSPINGHPFYILLDAVFEPNHYDNLVEKEIRNELLLTAPDYLKVKIPSPDCILADKLTAFAPHTIGILLNTGKDMEVMKQLYDVMSLIEVYSDMEIIRKTYYRISVSEAAYRGIAQSSEDCLWDSFYAVLNIAARGKINPEEYKLYVNGIREMRSHIYTDSYSPEVAALRSAKVMYFILCLIFNQRFSPTIEAGETTRYLAEPLSHQKLLPLKYMKKIAPEAYVYAVKADKLLKAFCEK